MAEPFSSTGELREGRNWAPILVGLGVMALVVAGLVLLGRRDSSRVTTADNYAQKLQISGVRVSQANNFIGATVTYLDLRLVNGGDRNVAGGEAQLVFRNTLGEVVQRETVPLRVLHNSPLGGYPDVVDLSMAPLTPGQTAEIRLVLEHVSSDWNRSFPGVEFVNLKYR